MTGIHTAPVIPAQAGIGLLLRFCIADKAA